MDFYAGFTTNFGMDHITLGVALFSPQRQELHVTHPALRYHAVDRSITHLFFIPCTFCAAAPQILRRIRPWIHFFPVRHDARARPYLGRFAGIPDRPHENGGAAMRKSRSTATDNNFGFRLDSSGKWRNLSLFFGILSQQNPALDYTTVKAQEAEASPDQRRRELANI